MNDLFLTPELIPTEVTNAFLKYSKDGEFTYDQLAHIFKEVNALGYTFDYYLDAEPFDLRQMNDEELTLATRQHFANICLACIEGATTGEYKVNDLDSYIERQTADYYAILAGMNDNTFTFQQYKHYLATGNCVALLP